MSQSNPSSGGAMQEKSKVTFSGSLAYILTTAGASVGLGNIWRFPYITAKYGGGAFLLTYIILAVTFGSAMIISETALGRSTGKSPIATFLTYSQSTPSRIGGWLNSIVPMIIVSYYCTIGGWVIRYMLGFLVQSADHMAADDFFGSFMSSAAGAEIFFLLFALCVFVVIIMGVNNGIERISKFMMPVLILLAVIIAVYSMTRPGAGAGIRYFLVPDLSEFSIMTVVAALGQMFYSLSIAMGILYTYGAYMKKSVDIETATWQVELFDTGVALLGGLMIIPAVFAFSGGDPEALQAGPSLMFITMPKIFASMPGGRVIGVLFFVMVFFAALTSAIALLETSISTWHDTRGESRPKAIGIMAVIVLVLGSLSSLGYGPLAMVKLFGMQILDFMDFLSNTVMMPLGALATCLLVRKIGVGVIADEVKLSSKFRQEKIFTFCIKYFGPICLVIIFLAGIANAAGWISM